MRKFAYVSLSPEISDKLRSYVGLLVILLLFLKVFAKVLLFFDMSKFLFKKNANFVIFVNSTLQNGWVLSQCGTNHATFLTF